MAWQLRALAAALAAYFVPSAAIEMGASASRYHGKLLRPASTLETSPGTNSFSQANASTNRSMSQQDLVDWIKEKDSNWSATVNEDYLNENAFYAMKAWNDTKHIRSDSGVTQELFYNDVLPYRQLDEPVDRWRKTFYEKLQPLVQNATSLKEIANRVIPAVFFDGKLSNGKKIEFKGNSTPAVMAPLTQTLNKTYASCTGLSILLTDALRAVGVPARVVGTPDWNLGGAEGTGGNHNWIEVFFENAWHFTDATPPPQDGVAWDNAWFTNNAAKAVAGGIHGIYTAVADPSKGNGQYTITWRTPYTQLPAEDRTQFYTSLQSEEAKDPDADKYRKASEGI